MDISKLELASASSEGTKMELLHPASDVPFDPPMYIYVAGVDSEVYQKVQKDLMNRRLKKAQSRNRIRFQATAEEIEAEQIELLAKCTLNWENIEYGGKPFPFNYENARKMYREFVWIREQVDSFIGDRANFLAS